MFLSVKNVVALRYTKLHRCRPHYSNKKTRTCRPDIITTGKSLGYFENKRWILISVISHRITTNGIDINRNRCISISVMAVSL